MGTVLRNETYRYSNYDEYKTAVKLWQIVPPILIILGTTGNILSIIVLSSSSFRNSTTAIFLKFLALSDLVVLYAGLLRQWIVYTFNTDVRTLSNIGCKIHIWIVYTSLDISSWILATVTIERIIAVWLPFQAKQKCTTKMAAGVVTTIFIFFLLFNCHFLIGFGKTGIESDSENLSRDIKCSELGDPNYADFFNKIWPWIDLSAFSILPSLVLIIGNTCILVKLIILRKQTQNRYFADANIRTEAGREHIPPFPKQSSLTVMLLTLNTVFLLTTLPVSVYNIGYPDWEADADQSRQATLELWWAVCNLLQYTNNCINFILYCFSGTRFRKSFIELVCARSLTSTTGSNSF